MSCATEYKFIQPLKIKYSEQRQQLDGTNIEITYRYNILEEGGNHRYAVMEDRNGISLLAVLIYNPGEDTIYFPEDLIIFAGYSELTPLKKNEALAALAQQSSFNEDVEIETKNAGIFYVPLSSLEVITLIKANKRFAKEMKEYYLVNSIIIPKSTVVGLLALSVRKNAPLKFELNKHEYE